MNQTCPLLQLKQAQAQYGFRECLNLSFESKKLIGLVGSNGSGKSSLLKLICGLNISAGQIEIAGQELSQFSPIERARKLSYLPQQTPISPYWTAYEVIEQGLYPYQGQISQKKQQIKIEQVTNRLHLAPLLHRSMAFLSGGERQRVLIARLLIQDTPIMMLDEPLIALDWKTQEQTLDTLKQISQSQDKLILIALHELNLAALYADELLMLKNGSLFAKGTSRELLEPNRIESLFETQICTVQHPNQERLQMLPWGPKNL